MKPAVTRALHTLWQAAVASGGVGEVLKSVTDHSVNVPGVEQGVLVAGTAVAAAGFSFGKHAVVALYRRFEARSAAHRVASAALAAIVADYQSKHAAAPDAAPVLPPAGDS